MSVGDGVGCFVPPFVGVTDGMLVDAVTSDSVGISVDSSVAFLDDIFIGCMCFYRCRFHVITRNIHC